MLKRKISILAILLCTLGGVSATETDPKTPQEKVEQLESRVYEIWNMDFKDMDHAEKLALKDEVKNIKKELKATKRASTVTLSIGAIIIILLLLILLT